MESPSPAAIAGDTETATTSTAMNTKIVTLVSSDGQEISIPEAATELSEVIKYMIEDNCSNRPIRIQEADGKTLIKVVKYMMKHGGEEGISDAEKKAFDREFLSGDTMEELFDVIMAANFLEIKGLLDLMASKIANIIKNKSVEWVRKKFGIVNDYSPEEEERVRNEFAWTHENIDEDEDI